MKQVIVDGPFVKEVIENAEEPITLGIAVPDETVVSVGQILEDDLTVRDVTDEDLLVRFGPHEDLVKAREFVLAGMKDVLPEEPAIYEVVSEQTTETTTEAPAE